MKFFIGIISLFLLSFSANATDGLVVIKDKERVISTDRAAPIFVYDSGTETELNTCIPGDTSVKTAAGVTVTAKATCEKVRIATNPDRLFTVTTQCTSTSPNITNICTTTNSLSTSWNNVQMKVIPLLDAKYQVDWASIYCPQCSWTFNQTSSTCGSSTSDSSGRVISHNFYGNYLGSCTVRGSMTVSDAETGKSWTSAETTALLRPTPPSRAFTGALTFTPGGASKMSSPATATSGTAKHLNSASIVVTPTLNGKPKGLWGADLQCAECFYSWVQSTNTCDGVVSNGTSLVLSHDVSTGESCTTRGYFSISDPETGWASRIPASGTFVAGLEYDPPPCIPLPAQTMWVAASGSCPAGYSGSRTWEKEQQSTSYCSTPTSPLQWTGYSDTGSIRNLNSNCTLIYTCTPAATQYQWVAASGTCPSGQNGSRTWEKQQQKTSYCPSPTSNPEFNGWQDTGATRSVNDSCAAAADPLASIVAGCLVDTIDMDYFQQNSCYSYGFRAFPQEAYVAFKAGLPDPNDTEGGYSRPTGYTFKWSGACAGNNQQCIIKGSCSSQSSCKGLGVKSSTVLITAPDGRTKTISVQAVDNTIVPGTVQD